MSFSSTTVVLFTDVVGVQNHTSPDSQSIHIEGIEQLWRIVLCAPDATLASSASAALVAFYLDVGVFF
jgi:hypothetical protein